ncbi:MAG: phosphatase PAP2 family protein [Clostridia bacterium]|nr:phosphatase PAP2 family protein [Clostridia bacterium]
MDAILNFDSSILLWIQDSLRAGFLTPVVKVITHLGDKGALWILITLALLCFRKTRRLGILCGIAMAIGLVVTNLVIKNWVARVRPYEVIPGLNCIVGLADDWSFPSGHTTNSLACGWVLFRKAPRRWQRVCALVMAMLISLSRLYVGIHYPTDVLGGAVIGICSACLAMWLFPMIEKRFPKIKRLYKKPRAQKAGAQR